MKYLLLGNVSFENAFKYGFLYHGTALVTLAILATAHWHSLHGEYARVSGGV